MATITQITDFKAEILIANTEQSYVSDLLQQFIDKYEPVYLKGLLGPDLYALYKAGMATDPVPAKWAALNDQISCGCANFIYWYWMGNKQTNTVGIGEAQSKAANAEMSSPILKMARAWDEMVDLNFDTVKFITDNTADYGAYYIADFFGWNRFCTWDRLNIFYKTQEWDL